MPFSVKNSIRVMHNTIRSANSVPSSLSWFERLFVLTAHRY
jgi:hypothetical protein